MVIEKSFIDKGMIALNNKPREVANGYILNSNLVFDLRIELL